MVDDLRPEVPPEPTLPYRLWYMDLEHHATALGYVCITYANLEANINRLIEEFLPCSVPARRAIVDATGTSIKSRCQLVLKLARIVAPDEQWFQDLDDLLTRVQSELAEDRNRLIHDQWVAGKEVLQLKERIGLRRLEAFAPKSLTPRELPRRPLEWVWDLVRRIQEVDVFLTQLLFAYAIWQQTGQPPALPPLPDDVRGRRPPAPPHPEDETKQPPPPPPFEK